MTDPRPDHRRAGRRHVTCRWCGHPPHEHPCPAEIQTGTAKQPKPRPCPCNRNKEKP